MEKLERSIKEGKDLEQNMTEQIINLKQELQNSNNQNSKFHNDWWVIFYNFLDDLRLKIEKFDKAYKDLDIERNNLNDQLRLLKETYSNIAIKQVIIEFSFHLLLLERRRSSKDWDWNTNKTSFSSHRREN